MTTDLPPLPDDFPLPEDGPADFAPYEQRIGPGMGGGGRSGGGASEPEPAPPAQLCAQLETPDLGEAVATQADLAYYGLPGQYQPPTGSADVSATSNREVWQKFLEEELYDTRRVRLEHVHLFEWFPLSPGRFHTPQAEHQRRLAYEAMFQTADGKTYFTPAGKASMILGGVGAVRLRPRFVGGEPHYFMTASSSAVCHEGFPVLVPRRFYGQLKPRLLQDGAVPVTLSGEMRYLPDDLPGFFGQKREIPRLLLHVDQLEILPAPRSGVTRFLVSAAVTFIGQVEGQMGPYLSYATFDPASRDSVQKAVAWLEEFYTGQQYPGQIVTDFDEVIPRFPQAQFGLADVMLGKLSAERARSFLEANGLPAEATRPYFVIYNQTVKQIHTGGGAYVEGSVYTEGGDFVGRDAG